MPRKTKWRTVESNFFLANSTPEERENGTAIYLGSQRPQLQGRLFLENLRLRPDQIWAVEREESAMAAAEAGCRELGINFYPGDVTDLLVLLQKKEGPKFISLDFHQVFGEEIAALLEKLHPGRFPMLLSVALQGRRDGGVRETQFGEYMKASLMERGMEEHFSAGEFSALGTKAFRRDLLQGLDKITRGIESETLSHRLKAEGVTHREARGLTLARTIVNIVQDDMDRFRGPEVFSEMIFYFAKLASEGIRKALRYTANPKKDTEGVKSMLMTGCMLHTIRAYPTRVERHRYISTSGGGGCPMESAFIRFEPMAPVLERHDYTSAKIITLMEDYLGHGMAGLRCTVAAEKKNPLRSHLEFWRDRKMIVSINLGSLITFGTEANRLKSWLLAPFDPPVSQIDS